MVDRIRRLIAGLDRWSLAHRWPRVMRRAIAGFLAHDALTYAGSMAYFGVLSLFQLLVLAIVVASLVAGEGQAREFVLDSVTGGSPLDRETVAGVLDAVIASRGGIGLIGGIFLLWSGLGVFSALNGGIGRAFEAAPRRPFWQDKLIGLLLMATTGLLAVASLVIGIVTGIIQAAVPGGTTVVGIVGLVVPFVLIMLAFWIIYRVVPNRPISFADAWPGALVAALLWTVLRFGFTYYATNIARYDSAFGPISTGVTLLVFLYFAAVIILLGAEVARARALDDEVPGEIAADPRFMPVPTTPAPTIEPVPSRRMPRWVLVAVAAIAGLVAGRLSKRDDDE